MAINKYFVFVPQDVTNEAHMELSKTQEAETLRQRLLKEAQEQGGF
ncbi:hypothetical protein AB4259_11770 [Vibrio amylolyticus]|nr:hypothetical protein [Vibrio sp. 10N.261.55.A7]